MKARHLVIHDGDADRVVARRNITVQHIALLAVLWSLFTGAFLPHRYCLPPRDRSDHTAMWR
jgi:dihydroorotase